MAIRDELAYLTEDDDLYGTGYLEILNIANPYSPVSLGTTPLTIQGASSIAISNTHAYVGSWSGVSAVNIENPNSPYETLPIRWVLVRDPLGEFTATAFLATDQAIDPLSILDWFIMRWGLEVTFEEARAHLGLETQRQWSDLAIQRTTPALLGLFSLVTLLAHQLSDGQPPVQTAPGIPNGKLPFRMRLLWFAIICGPP